MVLQIYQFAKIHQEDLNLPFVFSYVDLYHALVQM
jgi:hypothetical protein